jgi:hypothetical protein
MEKIKIEFVDPDSRLDEIICKVNEIIDFIQPKKNTDEVQLPSGRIVDLNMVSSPKEERPNQTNTLEETREGVYRIVDSFLTEASDQNGNFRNLDRLNKDRHLAVDNLMELLTSSNNSLIERIKEFVGEDEIPAVIPHHNPYLTGQNTERQRIRNFLSTLNEKQ